VWVETGDKFITGVVDTAEQFLPVTTTPATFIQTRLSLLTIFTGDKSLWISFFPDKNIFHLKYFL
jgi:hypothetical protein